MSKYKTIEDYPNYEVNKKGVVRSKERVYLNQFGKSNKVKPRIVLKTYLTTSGYLQVDLCKNAKYKKMSVHRLVALYFVKGFVEGYEVNHIDCDKTNNHRSNLEWVTSKENKQHAWANGLYPPMTEAQRLARSANGKLNKGRKRKTSCVP